MKLTVVKPISRLWLIAFITLSLWASTVFGITVDNIITMHESKLPPNIIVQTIKSSGVTFNLTLKDIKLHSLVDPEVPGVTCHIASIEANLSFSDPSDSAISCRQTGEITPQMIAQIDKSDSGEIVFRQSKSIFFKTMISQNQDIIRLFPALY